ncbi:hypothetical protein E3N88_16003 [Mikania micrantha]|uniref:Uncharacterized protein n=1 Tax=Mikania micrantha TaxID=192012 RepID=A0A5N6NZA3_9ASTR|nr:hypothetical protein E3N88_16003 [Mikania micrantha]
MVTLVLLTQATLHVRWYSKSDKELSSVPPHVVLASSKCGSTKRATGMLFRSACFGNSAATGSVDSESVGTICSFSSNASIDGDDSDVISKLRVLSMCTIMYASSTNTKHYVLCGD